MFILQELREPRGSPGTGAGPHNACEQGWVSQDPFQAGNQLEQPQLVAAAQRQRLGGERVWGLGWVPAPAPQPTPPSWCSIPWAAGAGDEGWEEGGSLFTQVLQKRLLR